MGGIPTQLGRIRERSRSLGARNIRSETQQHLIGQGPDAGAEQFQIDPVLLAPRPFSFTRPVFDRTAMARVAAAVTGLPAAISSRAVTAEPYSVRLDADRAYALVP
jgi:hypothetical protein